MVEVFKTNVQQETHSEKMVTQLLYHFPNSRISFDLEDCDKILRVEGNQICPDTIIKLVREGGFECRILE